MDNFRGVEVASGGEQDISRRKLIKALLFTGGAFGVSIAGGSYAHAKAVESMFIKMPEKLPGNPVGGKPDSRAIGDTSFERMFEGFMGEKSGPHDTKLLLAHIRVHHPKGAPLPPGEGPYKAMSGFYTWDHRRLHIDPSEFIKMNIDVYHDRKNQIVALRRPGVPGVLLTSSNRNVVLVWCESAVEFETWWDNGWSVGQLVNRKPLMKLEKAPCYPVLHGEGEQQTLRIPLRVLAGAVNARPIAPDTVFHPGPEPMEAARNSVTDIYAKRPIEPRLGLHNNQWQAKLHIKSALRVGNA